MTPQELQHAGNMAMLSIGIAVGLILAVGILMDWAVKQEYKRKRKEMEDRYKYPKS